MHVIVYELNEVPWRVVDHHVQRHPDGAFARVLAEGATFTTRVDGPLHPWVAWPTLHRGLPPAEHGVRFLGQDPTSTRGEPLWEALSRAGRSIGVFGSFWALAPPAGMRGFFVPDLFQADGRCEPAGLAPFHHFQRTQAEAGGRVVPTGFDLRGAARIAPTLLRLGARLRTLGAAAAQLADERRDPRRRYRRPLFAAHLGMDLFEAAWRRYRPDYAAFFTNHQAYLMHRFWRASFPGDAAEADLSRPQQETARPGLPEGTWRGPPPMDEDDRFYAEALPHGMELADAQLDRLLRLAETEPGTIVVLASALGQAARPVSRNLGALRLTNPGRLRSALQSPPFTLGRAMEPDVPLQFATAGDATCFTDAASRIADPDGAPLFTLQRTGARVLLHVNQHDAALIYRRARLGADDHPLAHFGVSHTPTESAASGGHIPEGILLFHGVGIPTDATRTRVEASHYRAALIALLGAGWTAAREALCPDGRRGG